MQPEGRIAAAIRTYMTEHGAFVFKVHGGPTMMAGLPDLIAVVRGRYVGVEVKTPTGKVSAVQAAVHRKIEAAGGLVIVARHVDDVKHLFD